jgi:hypothetical protein
MIKSNNPTPSKLTNIFLKQNKLIKSNLLILLYFSEGVF